MKMSHLPARYLPTLRKPRTALLGTGGSEPPVRRGWKIRYGLIGRRIAGGIGGVTGPYHLVAIALGKAIPTREERVTGPIDGQATTLVRIAGLERSPGWAAGIQSEALPVRGWDERARSEAR